MTARERDNTGHGTGPPHPKTPSVAPPITPPITPPTTDDATSPQPTEEVKAYLEAMRRQLGEHAWTERLNRAHEREEIVLAILKRQKAGLSRAAALRDVDSPASYFSVSRWIERYQSGGFLNLIDRWGPVAASREPTAEPPPIRTPSRRGRKAVSFLKWAGGKSMSAKQILELKPEQFSTYYEPFVGAGSVFLKLKPERAVLSDTNAELMNCYEVIRDSVELLIEVLGQHRNSYEHFVEVRARQPGDLPPVERAARTIFLNKTCFNGLFRLNKKGHFNVPFGKHRNPNFCDIPTLQRISKQLEGVTLRHCDFDEALADVAPDSFIYFDPPYYHPDRHRKHHYYHPDAFGEDDHRRLAARFRELDLLGCHLLLSNSNHPFVRDLYEGYSIETIKLRRPINAKASGRDGWTEVLIHNRRST